MQTASSMPSATQLSDALRISYLIGPFLGRLGTFGRQEVPVVDMAKAWQRQTPCPTFAPPRLDCSSHRKNQHFCFRFQLKQTRQCPDASISEPARLCRRRCKRTVASSFALLNAQCCAIRRLCAHSCGILTGRGSQPLAYR